MDILDESIKYFLLFLVGAFSGFINVIAGGGSMVTLPLLMGFGMPAPIANGTNRISILFQDIAGIIKFIKAGKLPIRIALILGIPTVIGSVVGAMFASRLNEMLLSIVIFVLLIAMSIYIIVKPPVIKNSSDNEDEEVKNEKNIDNSNLIKKNDATQKNIENINNRGRVDKILNKKIKDKKIGVFSFVLFLIVGIYAGFIQVGSTLIWYAILTWKMKFGFISANAIKLFLNFIMTPIALFVFILHHQVAFVEGIIIGVGSFIGAWISAKIAMKLSAKVVKIMMLIIFTVAASYVLLFKIIGI